jgi:hypothetical protein
MTTLEFDVVSNTNPAFSFAAADLLVTVNFGVLVHSTAFGGDGIRSSLNNDDLVNNGFVLGNNALGSRGVSFTGDNGTITNNATGTIRGQAYGVHVNGISDTVINRGTIIGTGFLGVAFESASGNGVLTNHGRIFGKLVGVLANNGTTVSNVGVIESDGTGLSAYDATSIDNSGTIRGEARAIGTFALSNGRVSLTNTGTIEGKIEFDADTGNLSDQIFNKGTIIGETRLGSGSDTFTFAKGIQGTVFGEVGADHFNFVGKLAKKKNAAVIGDFTPGEDTIGLSKKLFKGIGKEGPLKEKYFEVGKKAKGDGAQVVYDPKSGDLDFKVKGGGQKLVAKLEAGLDLSASDILVLA